MKFKALFLFTFVFAAFTNLSAQDCDKLELQYYKFYRTKDYQSAYPIWKQALENCADKKKNVFNHGETILVDFIDNAQSKADTLKYAKELKDLIDLRIQKFPEGKEAFWKGENVTYQLKYGLIDQMQALNEYDKIFNADDVQKISASAVFKYFETSLLLLNAGKIDFNKALDVYFATKTVAEGNIDLRSEEIGNLVEKQDSLQALTPPKSISKREQSVLESSQQAKEVFVTVSESMESVLEQYTTCETVVPYFETQFEANKDSIEWLEKTYVNLTKKECVESPFMEKLLTQYTKRYYEEHPDEKPVAGNTNAAPTKGVVSSCYANGVKAFKNGQYSSAIKELKCAIDQVEGRSKGDVAYYIALAYQKSGNNSSAVSWAKKAANYKSGWGAPYLLISGIFGGNANSCGSNKFQKLSAYWVAADYANKACAVDSRSCGTARKYAGSYEANAPTAEEAFGAGKKKGDRVSVSCFGGATTRVR